MIEPRRRRSEQVVQIGKLVGILLALTALVAAQITNLAAVKTARDAVVNANDTIKDKKSQVDALRERVTATGHDLDLERQRRLYVNCAGFDQQAQFTAVVARVIAASPQITAEQRKEVRTLTVPLPRPAACPPKEQTP